MSTSPAPPNIDQGWTPEPELREPTPRRIEPVFDYPDMNKPNVMIFSAVGGALAAIGVVLFVLGFSKGIALLLLGIILAVGGIAMLVIFPQKAKAYEERARHLIENGLPIMANVLTSDNLTGDSTYGRAVKYQVALPGGAVVNREVNADERRLPKMIPGKATALVDMASGDVELYCALPYQAIARPASATPAYTTATQQAAAMRPTDPVPADTMGGIPTAPPVTAGTMGTLGTISTPTTPPPAQRQSQTQETTPPPATPAPPPPTAPADNKLPWE